MNELAMLRAKVERCRQTYEKWQTRFGVTQADRNDALMAYDAAIVALGMEWRVVAEVLGDTERTEARG